jgi:hypothetical protein
MTKLNPYRLAFLTLVSCLCLSTTEVKAETCTPLQLVGGEGSRVTKTVSQPTIPGPWGINITGNNWNTDWAVPGGRMWKNFKVKVTSEQEQSFNVRMFLKFADQTSEEGYNQTAVVISPTKPLSVRLKPKNNQQPFQVNLFVGDVKNIGQTYTAEVSACY